MPKSKSFRSIKELNRHIEKSVNNTLQKEVAQTAKSAMAEAVEEEVYSRPSGFYKRRGTDGGLGDTDNMRTELTANGELTLTNETEVNPFQRSDGSYFNNAFPSEYGLAEIVEFGNAGGIVSNPARPFHGKTVEKLKDGRTVDAIRKGLERQGISIKK